MPYTAGPPPVWQVPTAKSGTRCFLAGYSSSPPYPAVASAHYHLETYVIVNTHAPHRYGTGSSVGPKPRLAALHVLRMGWLSCFGGPEAVLEHGYKQKASAAHGRRNQRGKDDTANTNVVTVPAQEESSKSWAQSFSKLSSVQMEAVQETLRKVNTGSVALVELALQVLVRAAQGCCIT